MGTWWSRLDLNQQCTRAADLQSTGVTNFPTTPLTLVLKAGIEPACPCERQILSLLCLPISPLEQIFYGAPEETRTPKIWLLRPTRIPIPSPGQNSPYISQLVSRCSICMSSPAGPLNFNTPSNFAS